MFVIRVNRKHSCWSAFELTEWDCQLATEQSIQNMQLIISKILRFKQSIEEKYYHDYSASKRREK